MADVPASTAVKRPLADVDSALKETQAERKRVRLQIAAGVAVLAEARKKLATLTDDLTALLDERNSITTPEVPDDVSSLDGLEN